MRYMPRITKGVFIWPYVILSVATITSCWLIEDNREIGRLENKDYKVVATLVGRGATATDYVTLDVADLKNGRAVHERTVARFDDAFIFVKFEILRERLLFMYTAWGDTSSMMGWSVFITLLDDPRIKGIRYGASPYGLDTLYTSSSSNDEYLVTVRQYEGSSQLFKVYINAGHRVGRGELLFAGVDSVGIALDDENILRTIPYWKRKPSDTLYFYVPSFWEENLVKDTSREALLEALGR